MIRINRNNKLIHNFFSIGKKVLPKRFVHIIEHKRLYYRVFKKDLNLKKPKLFNEKIHWLILNEYGIKEAMCADKIKVKEIIKQKEINDLYIPKTFKIIEKNEKIDFKKLYDILPEKFVIKCNHNSGKVSVCYNKKDFNLEEQINLMLPELEKNYADILKEYHYSLIEPKIMIEEYIDDKINKLPIDYKFYSFNGETKCVLICKNRKIDIHKYKAVFYDKNWERLYYYSDEDPNGFEKPNNFDRMWEISEILSKGHKFVRVDLYNIDGKIYFSELTFSPSAGLCTRYTDEANKILGSYIKLK